MSALDRAISVAGNQTNLARAIGTTQQNISYWRTKGKVVPGEYVLPIESATNFQVTRYELRPDLYPAEEQEPTAA